MCKKLIITATTATGIGLLVFGTDLVSYVGTTLGWAKDSVKNSIPIEFEINRARNMIANLVPDIRKNMHTIAKEEVEVAQLARQIEDLDARQSKDRTELMRLRNDLSSGKTALVYAGRTYTAEQVKTDLARRFERYKTGDATLSSLKDMHTARQRSLEAARQKLEGMLAARRQLEVEVEHIEARLKMVEAAQTTSEYNFDDSQLSRVKQLVTDLRTRLDVAERLVNAEGALGDEIPLSEPSSETILDELTQYFGGHRDTASVATAGR